MTDHTQRALSRIESEVPDATPAAKTAIGNLIEVLAFIKTMVPGVTFELHKADPLSGATAVILTNIPRPYVSGGAFLISIFEDGVYEACASRNHPTSGDGGQQKETKQAIIALLNKTGGISMTYVQSSFKP